MDQERGANESDQAVEPLLALTDKAIEMIKQAMVEKGVHSGGIRLTVEGGGCRGFEYSLTFANAARSDDTVIVQDGIPAFLDPVSARHLQGTRLDYVSNRHGTGFHFFGLDAARTIGCGSSILLRRCIAGNTRTMGCTLSAKRPLLAITAEVVQPGGDSRSSISHPNLRPLSICPRCRYVVCRCEKTV
jgi:iron-sulfur cluster assembly accessory protein